MTSNTIRTAPLTAAARRLLRWDPDPAACSVSFRFPTPPEMNAADVAEMLNALIDCHEMLRTRYTYGPQATCVIEPVSGEATGPARVDVPIVELGGVDRPEIDELIDRERAAAIGRLNPADGRMLAPVLFVRPDGTDENILLVTANHLGVDAVSSRILWRDLATYVRQWSAGEPISLEPERFSCSEWVEFLTDYAATRIGELDYWLGSGDDAPYAPTRPGSPDPVLIEREIAGSLAHRVMAELPALFHASYTRILLVAYGLAIEDVLGRPRPIHVPRHGRYSGLRPGIDLSQTVGWLADDYVWYRQATDGDHGRRMRHALESFPRHPEDYTLLSGYHAEAAQRFQLLPPKFYFNFLGDMGTDTHRALAFDRLGYFDLSMFAGVHRDLAAPRIYYGVHSPLGGLGAECVDEVVSQWISILGGLV